MSNSDIARGILEREKEHVRIRVADPSIWNKTPLKQGGQGPSIQEDMAKEGVYFIKADNDRLNGKMQVHQRLKVDAKYDENDVCIERVPRCRIFSSCEHFWRTMTELRENSAPVNGRVPKKNASRREEDVDTDQEDHVYDTFRYGCMFRPIRPKPAEKPKKNTFLATRERIIKAKNMAASHGMSYEDAYQRV